MPWFKVDDGFHGHPKVVDLSLPAVGLWTLAGSWCAKYLTDGRIGLKAITRLGGSESDALELVEAGLWLPSDGGDYQFKDWEKYQPLKVDIEAERDAARERMKSVRAKKKVRPAASPEPDGSGEVRANNTGTFGRSSEEVRVTPSHPIPSHPDPTPNGVVGVSSPNVTRDENDRPGPPATRIPADFKPTPHMLRWAQDNAPNVDWKTSTRKFTAHYRSVSGRTQFKTDWVEAWKAWLIGDQEKNRGKPTTNDRVRAGLQLAERFKEQEPQSEIEAP